MKSTDFIKARFVSAEWIWRDCQPFLQSIGKIDNYGMLYRGLRKVPATSIQKLLVPKNRKPADMPMSLHIAIDSWFDAKFGIKFRSDSVFCSGSISAAESYGSLFAVYPIGNFDYCYSSKATDLYMKIRRRLKDLNLWHNLDDNPNSLSISMNDLGNIMTEFDYHVNGSIEDFRKGIQSRHEMMIHCDSYYAVPADYVTSVNKELQKMSKS